MNVGCLYLVIKLQHQIKVIFSVFYVKGIKMKEEFTYVQSLLLSQVELMLENRRLKKELNMQNSIHHVNRRAKVITEVNEIKFGKFSNVINFQGDCE